MKFIFSFAIALCTFFTTLNTPFLQVQEPLSENWKIEGPIVEQIYPSTQSRGIFIDARGLVLHKRGTYPSDTLQLQLDSAYTDLYVELQDGSGTLAMVMGEKRPPGVKHMPISSVIYAKDRYIQRSVSNTSWKEYNNDIIHLTEKDGQWSIYDSSQDIYFPLGEYRPETLELTVVQDKVTIRSIRILKQSDVLLDETYKSSAPTKNALMVAFLFFITSLYLEPKYWYGLFFSFGLLFVESSFLIVWLDMIHVHISTTEMARWLFLLSFLPSFWIYIVTYTPSQIKINLLSRQLRKYVGANIARSIEGILKKNGLFIFLLFLHFMFQSPILIILFLLCDLYIQFQSHSHFKRDLIGVFCYIVILVSPMFGSLLILCFRVMPIFLQGRHLLFVAILLTLFVEITLSQLHMEHFERGYQPVNTEFDVIYDDVCDGIAWQVVGANAVLAPKPRADKSNTTKNSYLIEIQRKYCSHLQIYKNAEALFTNSMDFVDELDAIPTVVHFGAQDLLTIRPHSKLPRPIQFLSQYSNLFHLFDFASITKKSPETSESLIQKIKRRTVEKEQPILLVLDVVQSNHTKRFSYVQQQINKLVEEHEHISTIDTISLFTDEERDQLLSDDFKMSVRGHYKMLSKVDDLVIDWLQSQTSPE